MNQATAIRIFEAAKVYCEKYYSNELDWAYSIRPETFRNLKCKQFLSEYCWVVYTSGFRVSTVESIFPNLQIAFKNFKLKDLAEMESIEPVLAIFNNKIKANSFLKGSKLIAKEGFSVFKKRLQREGFDILEQLPGIGPITKYHLAKNIGLVDEAKCDIWLVRAADLCSTTVKELVAFLSERYCMSRHVVDIIIWRYGSDKGLV